MVRMSNGIVILVPVRTVANLRVVFFVYELPYAFDYEITENEAIRSAFTGTERLEQKKCWRLPEPYVYGNHAAAMFPVPTSFFWRSACDLYASKFAKIFPALVRNFLTRFLCLPAPDRLLFSMDIPIDLDDEGGLFSPWIDFAMLLGDVLLRFARRKLSKNLVGGGGGGGGGGSRTGLCQSPGSRFAVGTSSTGLILSRRNTGGTIVAGAAIGFRVGVIGPYIQVGISICGAGGDVSATNGGGTGLSVPRIRDGTSIAGGCATSRVGLSVPMISDGILIGGEAGTGLDGLGTCAVSGLFVPMMRVGMLI